MRATFMLVSTAVFLSSLAAPPTALAWRGWRARHADRNKDGVVTPVEVRKEHQWEMQHRSRVNTRWEARADTDNDGRVEPGEARAYKLRVMDADHDGIIDAAERKVYWVGWQGVVSTEVEKKYDADGNGVLTWNETREMLKDRARIVETDGQALVDTDIEREFDDNGDGVIDPAEAKAIREATD